MEKTILEKISKELGLNETQKDLLFKIFSNYQLDIHHLKEFEKSVLEFEKRVENRLSSAEEKTLNQIRQKLKFFDPKFVLCTTKYLKKNQRAKILGKDIPIVLENLNELHLRWKFDCKYYDKLNEKEQIEIALMRDEDHRFYRFSVVIESIDLSPNRCTFTTDHTDAIDFDKRREKRFNSKLPAKINFKAEPTRVVFTEGEVTNLNGTGMQLRLYSQIQKLKPSSLIRVCILFKNGFEESLARVVYIDSDNSLVGARFEKSPPSFTKALQIYLDSKRV